MNELLYPPKVILFSCICVDIAVYIGHSSVRAGTAFSTTLTPHELPTLRGRLAGCPSRGLACHFCVLTAAADFSTRRNCPPMVRPSRRTMTERANERDERVRLGQTIPHLNWQCPHCRQWHSGLQNGPQTHLRSCKARKVRPRSLSLPPLNTLNDILAYVRTLGHDNDFQQPQNPNKIEQNVRFHEEFFSDGDLARSSESKCKLLQ